jgi:hypothetical protein
MKRFLNKHHAEVFFPSAFVAVVGIATVMISIPVGVVIAVIGFAGMVAGIYGIATL